MSGGTAGEILDFVPVLFPPENLKTLGPYVSVFVGLRGGGRTFGVFLGDAARLRIGAPVVLRPPDAERTAPVVELA